MAGRQFSFFLSGSDQIRFEEALRVSGDIAFLEVWPKTSHAVELKTSTVSRMGNEILDILIARREDIGSIRFHPIKGRAQFSCDPVVSNVVEFSRCYTSDRFIRAGRLYRVDEFWDENKKIIRKSVKFTEWADRLYSVGKKSLIKIEQGYYAGMEALELRKAGTAFEGLDIPIGAVKVSRF